MKKIFKMNSFCENLYDFLLGGRDHDSDNGKHLFWKRKQDTF